MANDIKRTYDEIINSLDAVGQSAIYYDRIPDAYEDYFMVRGCSLNEHDYGTIYTLITRILPKNEVLNNILNNEPEKAKTMSMHL